MLKKKPWNFPVRSRVKEEVKRSKVEINVEI